VKESNLPSSTSPINDNRFTAGREDHVSNEWQGSESNRQHHEGLSFAAFPICVPCRAPPMGFEPTISCVTGRRPLRTGPRGRSRCRSISEPNTLRAEARSKKYRRLDSNQHCSRSKRDASFHWATPAASDPGWTRTTVCLLVRQLL
jgi:hypothetical protein